MKRQFLILFTLILITFQGITQNKTQAYLGVKEGGSDFEPDNKAEYSNSNFVLLTFILEKVCNKTYGEILEEIIIKTIGAKTSLIGFSRLAINSGNSIRLIHYICCVSSISQHSGWLNLSN
ncbi:hypothetical protein N9164_02770 [Draconibacterium sp.]|nr:hypothetical protein [Draconibacterium sp.]